MSARDVESLQHAHRERSRCMDTFLLGSVILLFVLVLSGGAVGFWVVKDLRTCLKPGFDGTFSKLGMYPGDPANLYSSYKMQDFAYLTANLSLVNNVSMRWAPVKYANTSSIGSRYTYESNHQSLAVKKDGTYFLYIQMNVTCPAAECTNGSLTVTFEDDKQNSLLSCSLHLRSPRPAVQKCWTVIPHFSGGTRLMAQMRTTVALPNYWKVDLNHSGFGMFLVDGPEAA